jgi:hypothetical protein
MSRVVAVDRRGVSLRSWNRASSYSTIDQHPNRPYQNRIKTAAFSPFGLSAERKQTPQIVENSSKRMEL